MMTIAPTLSFPCEKVRVPPQHRKKIVVVPCAEVALDDPQLIAIAAIAKCHKIIFINVGMTSHDNIH